MRWLRCLLSREFPINLTLMYWDYIFCGIESKHRTDLRIDREEFLSPQEDPLINLDYLCVAMILHIKNKLLESDFSMCLAYLLKYPEPLSPANLLMYAQRIKEKINEKINPCSIDTIISGQIESLDSGSTPETFQRKSSEKQGKRNPYIEEAKQKEAQLKNEQAKFPFISPLSGRNEVPPQR